MAVLQGEDVEGPGPLTGDFPQAEAEGGYRASHADAGVRLLIVTSPESGSKSHAGPQRRSFGPGPHPPHSSQSETPPGLTITSAHIPGTPEYEPAYSQAMHNLPAGDAPKRSTAARGQEAGAQGRDTADLGGKGRARAGDAREERAGRQSPAAVVHG